MNEITGSMTVDINEKAAGFKETYRGSLGLLSQG